MDTLAKSYEVRKWTCIWNCYGSLQKEFVYGNTGNEFYYWSCSWKTTEGLTLAYRGGFVYELNSWFTLWRNDATDTSETLRALSFSWCASRTLRYKANQAFSSNTKSSRFPQYLGMPKHWARFSCIGISYRFNV